jgi:diacylglycerol kinase (ATP)
MTRYKIIVNPISGRGNGELYYPVVENRLRELDIDFEICQTERPGHAIELAESASEAGFDVVAAVGGDGTVNEVINGLMIARVKGFKPTALGVISIGRGNDFAFGAQVPPELEDACRSLVMDERKSIDVGFVKGGDYPAGRYFGNGIGIGFDAVVGFEALKMRRLRGFPSYIAAALKTITLYFHAPLLQIEFNEETLVQPSLMVSIMNGRRMGGGFMMAPESLIDDGLFDLCIAGEVSRLAIFGLILRFMRGTQLGHPAIRTARSDHITVTALKDSLPAHADGETLCVAGKSLEVRLLPNALEVVIPG